VKAGLYVHVPFCRHRCHFCAFLITTHTDTLDRWTDGVVHEIGLRAAEFPETFDTIYLGGGTPSLAPPDAIDRVLSAAHEHLDIEAGAEVTLEANPDDLTEEILSRYRESGVSRLSLGIQSLRDEDLEFLTRTHSAEEGVAAFRAARKAGFANITVDLLYGLPHRTREEWRDILDRTLDLGPDHVSAYQLTFEPGTPFKRYRDTGRIPTLTEEEERARFLFTREWLAAAGYEQYEVSSFAREPRFESRHNKKYWEGAPYLGVGPAAHGYRPPERWWNAAAVRTWAADLKAGRLPTAGAETPTAEERRLERLFLGLRTTRGVALDVLGEEPESIPLVARLVEEGLAVLGESHLRLTPTGLAVADAVARELAASLEG